ncbi:DUF192 domain-containing protein [Tissierella creatinini]|nr:DUF192 domain-containing protein [Tissierella creatinini]TJX61517.1 DUF192 domain-containing protein [Soehngenia saccharolytica]
MGYEIYNLSKGNKLLDNVKIADSFFTRLKGLLGEAGLRPGEGILIKPCNSIHTFGMKFPIDVAFVDKSNMVVHIMEDIPKGKLSPIVKGAKYVIEARAGEYKAKGLEVGDIIEIGD